MASPSPSKFTSYYYYSSAFLSILLLIFFLIHILFSSPDAVAVALARCRCVSDKLLSSSRALHISRKMLQEMKKEMEEGVDGGETRRPAVGWEQLRRVPSGPDPLHHNGGSPKKPRTP